MISKTWAVHLMHFSSMQTDLVTSNEIFYSAPLLSLMASVVSCIAVKEKQNLMTLTVHPRSPAFSSLQWGCKGKQTAERRLGEMQGNQVSE